MFPVLDAKKNCQKACLMHALIPDYLGLNAASQYKQILSKNDSNKIDSNFFCQTNYFMGILISLGFYFNQI